MGKNTPRLRDALDRHKGKDRKKEHELSRQRQMQKDAVTRKQVHGAKMAREVISENAEDDEEEVEDVEGGVDVEKGEEEEDDEWESDTDEEANAGFDLSRLEDTDSDSDDDDDVDDVPDSNPIKKALASLKANGIPKTTTTTTSTTKTPKATKPAKAAKATAKTIVTPVADVEDEDEEDDEDDAGSDIPLSDLSDTGSAAGDIIPHQRLTINNTVALTRAVESIALPTATLSFSEHQSLTTSAPVSIPDIEDDLNRELAFYSQSLSAVKEARRLLTKEGVNFTRPTDFFAEMVKSDEHMGKIKAKLVDDAAGKRASADARKQRDLKKFGKQVQQEKLKERAMAKNQMLDKVKSLKRKRQDGGLDTANEEGLFDVALEDAATTEKRDRAARKSTGGKKGMEGAPNPKRARKNEKFGFGGKKKFSKSGDAQSSADMTGFSHKKMKGKDKGGASKRLGKARRAKAR